MELQKPQTLRERMFQPQAVTGPVNIGAPQQQSLRQSLLTPESDLTLSAGNVAYFDDIESQPDSKVTSDQNQSTASATGEITSAIPQSGWYAIFQEAFLFFFFFSFSFYVCSRSLINSMLDDRRTLWSGMLNDAETHDSTTKVFKTSYKYRSTTINGQKTEIVEQQDAQGNKEVRAYLDYMTKYIKYIISFSTYDF